MCVCVCLWTSIPDDEEMAAMVAELEEARCLCRHLERRGMSWEEAEEVNPSLDEKSRIPGGSVGRIGVVEEAAMEAQVPEQMRWDEEVARQLQEEQEEEESRSVRRRPIGLGSFRNMEDFGLDSSLSDPDHGGYCCHPCSHTPITDMHPLPSLCVVCVLAAHFRVYVHYIFVCTCPVRVRTKSIHENSYVCVFPCA